MDLIIIILRNSVRSSKIFKSVNKYKINFIEDIGRVNVKYKLESDFKSQIYFIDY